MDMGEYMKDYRARRRARAIVLLGGKCVECSSTKNLEFDHKDPATKDKEVSKHLWDQKPSVIAAELRKCQLLCEDCHKKKTKKNGDISREREAAQHGSLRMYKAYKCRCNACTENHRQWRRGYNAKRKLMGRYTAMDAGQPVKLSS